MQISIFNKHFNMPKANDKLLYKEPAKFDEELFCASIEARSCLYDKGDKNYHWSDAVDAAWHEVKKIHHFKLGEISLKFYSNSSFFDCVTYTGIHYHHHLGQWTQKMTVFSVTMRRPNGACSETEWGGSSRSNPK